MTFKQVTVYHSAKRGEAGGLFEPYAAGDPVAPVFTYVATGPGLWAAADTEVEAEHAFHMFNAPEDYLGGQDAVTAAQYRALKLRSLSVGDVVAVGGDVYGCGRVGWHKLDTVPAALNVQPSPWQDEIWAAEVAGRDV